MNAYQNWVDISFTCLPLRTIGRFDVPMDASPVYRARCERIKRLMELHGSHNSYFLYNARCVFHLTNRPDQGMLEFKFEGVALTADDDLRTERCDLEVELVRETCDWLSEPIVQWFRDSVQKAVAVEFDRYIAAGDLEQARQRLAKMQAAAEQSGGYVGMYL